MAGPCSVDADAVIDVKGSVRVLSGTVLDEQSAPSTITVRHDITGAPGSLVGLGCQPPFVVRNTIGRNITCSGLTPGVFGYGNAVGRHALGQCASLAGP